MRIRYFAGAAEAAGVAEETIASDFDVTVADLIEQLSGDRERLAKVLAVSTLLVDGQAARARTELVPAGAQVDVLPPFAGG
ncbi:MAG: MoaD/ThiS family protein [Micropruina sp.]